MNPKILKSEETITNSWKRGQWCYKIFRPSITGMDQCFLVSYHIIQILNAKHIKVLNPWTGSLNTMHISQVMTLDEALKALEEAND